MTVSSSDSAYGNTMTSVDLGVADLAATVDLNANGAEGAEGMKVVIGANDMTGRVVAVYDAEGNKVRQTEEVNETNRTLTAVANLPVVAWRAELMIFTNVWVIFVQRLIRAAHGCAITAVNSSGPMVIWKTTST